MLPVIPGGRIAAAVGEDAAEGKSAGEKKSSLGQVTQVVRWVRVPPGTSPDEAASIVCSNVYTYK